MSTKASALSAFPEGLAATDRAAWPGDAGVVCVVAAAWVQDFASRPAGPGTSAMRAEAEPRGAPAADVGPQVYCLRHAREHAAQGLAPCAEIGCTGCGQGN